MKNTIKKILGILIFFSLIEYQVFVGKENYSLVAALGLVALCIYEFIKGDGNLSFTDTKISKSEGDEAKAFAEVSKSREERKKLTFGEKAAAAVYGIVILLTLIFGPNSGAQFTFILVAGVLGVTALSILKPKRNDESWTSSFTIPKIYLYLMSYLLSIQIHESAAYQSILLLSCLVLWEIGSGSEKMALHSKNSEISEHEFKHYLFHRWSKYWNYFLGIWFIIALRENGVITGQYEYILLFAFMVMFFSFLMRNESHFTIRDFLTVTVASALLSGISPLMSAVFGKEIPAYLLASAIFVAFDLADIYFHQRDFKESTLKFWSQKAALYLLMGIYVAQVHFMMTNANFGVDQITASLF